MSTRARKTVDAATFHGRGSASASADADPDPLHSGGEFEGDEDSEEEESEEEEEEEVPAKRLSNKGSKRNLEELSEETVTKKVASSVQADRGKAPVVRKTVEAARGEVPVVSKRVQQKLLFVSTSDGCSMIETGSPMEEGSKAPATAQILTSPVSTRRKRANSATTE